jgi:hypothetical protein
MSWPESSCDLGRLELCGGVREAEKGARFSGL